MANKKDLAPLTFPKIAPYKMTAEYRYSKAIESITKKKPEWDLARKDPLSDLVAHKRELDDSEKRLEEKRTEAIKKRQEIDQQWKDLENKEHMLKENFTKFNKFVKENQEKRERAERKLADDTALTEKRTIDVNHLQDKYEYMYDIKLEMEKNIRSHRMYQDYLIAVIKAFPIFRTLEEVLDRYETLADARKELALRQEKELTALEVARIEMIKITEEKTLAIMGLYNIMAELQGRYETAKNKALQWETMVTKIKNTSVEKLAELQTIRQSCWSIYVSMCKRKEIKPEIRKDDIENQLMFIKRTMQELKRITKISLKRLSTRDTLIKQNLFTKQKTAGRR